MEMERNKSKRQNKMNRKNGYKNHDLWKNKTDELV